MITGCDHKHDLCDHKRDHTVIRRDHASKVFTRDHSVITGRDHVRDHGVITPFFALGLLDLSEFALR